MRLKNFSKTFVLHSKSQSQVLFGNFILNLNKILNKGKFSSLVLFYDPKIFSKHRGIARLLKKIPMQVVFIPVVSDESKKSFEQCSNVIDKLVKKNVDRRALFMGLGGGVVGDFSGFIASLYMRGVAYASVPTTLLSVVDSSIGGKNGVNFKSSKNLLGQIRQPDFIFIDVSFLKTLPLREFISGMGEVVKYSFLSKDIPLLDGKLKKVKIQKLIQKCIELKMSFVVKDEQDTKGIRQALNLGHTLGHALESYTAYRSYKHGEAILWGLKFSLLVSKEMGFLKEPEFSKLAQSIQAFPLPPLPPKIKVEKLYQLALRDKKSENKTVKMVLLKKRGQVVTSVPVSKEIFFKCVKFL